MDFPQPTWPTTATREPLGMFTLMLNGNNKQTKMTRQRHKRVSRGVDVKGKDAKGWWNGLFVNKFATTILSNSFNARTTRTNNLSWRVDWWRNDLAARWQVPRKQKNESKNKVVGQAGLVVRASERIKPQNETQPEVGLLFSCCKFELRPLFTNLETLTGFLWPLM